MATPRPDPREAPRERRKLVCHLSTPEMVDKILLFAQRFTGKQLYNYQYILAYRIVESILLNDGEVLTALWARQSGKSECISIIAIGLCVLLPILAREFPEDPRVASFRNGFRVGIYAPVQEQATIPFSRMREFATCERAEQILADPELGVSVTVSRGDTVAFSNGSFVQARSASPDSQIEGKTYELVILEEAQKLSRTKVEKEIMPFLTATNGTAVKIGTAWQSRGGFHTSIQQNIERFRKTGKRNHYEFPYDLVIKEKASQYAKEKAAYEADPDNNPPPNNFHLNYEKYIAGQIRRLGGTDSIEFKMNYRCLWNESRVVAMDEYTLDQAMAPDLEAAPVRSRGFQVAGLDLGKIRDRTVLTLMEVDRHNPIINYVRGDEADEEKQVYYRKTVQDWLELEGVFEGAYGQYETLIEYIRMTSISVLCMDATGRGDVIYERLAAMLGDSVTIIPFVFSLPTKSNGYKYMFQEWKAGRLFYPAGPNTRETTSYTRFREELLSLDRFQVGNHVIVAAPEGNEEHDDYPDSLMLACWAEKVMEQVAVPVIEVVTGSSAPRGEARYRGGRSYRA